VPTARGITDAQLAEWTRKGLVRLPAPRRTAFGVRVVVPVPPRLSDLTNNVPGVGRVPTKLYRRWQAAAVPLLRAMPPPPAHPVEVCVLILPGKGWRVTADVANREKATTDALVKAGVLPDDNQRYVAGVRVGVDLLRPRGKATQAAVWLAPAGRWWE
jgi:hypothetical protein